MQRQCGRSFILPSLQFRGCHTTMFDFRISCLVICCVPIAKISFTHKRLHRPSKQGQSGNPCKKPSWLPAPSVMNEGTLSHFHERVWSVPWLSTQFISDIMTSYSYATYFIHISPPTVTPATVTQYK